MQRFWNWTSSQETEADNRVLHLDGVIAESTWLDDDVTPALFKDELNEGTGPITVWINSVGGDCIAAAQIYNMLAEYPDKVTVKIDGIAASAASVIAMAGDTVLMSPVSTMMIHNPATLAVGDHTDMEKAIDMLGAVKDSIINAYQRKTGLPRSEISRMMDSETWMDATKAVELGFADGIIPPASGFQSTNDDAGEKPGMLFSQRRVDRELVNRLQASGVPVQPLYERLNRLKENSDACV